jgi:hypothetical protein
MIAAAHFARGGCEPVPHPACISEAEASSLRERLASVRAAIVSLRIQLPLSTRTINETLRAIERGLDMPLRPLAVGVTESQSLVRARRAFIANETGCSDAAKARIEELTASPMIRVRDLRSTIASTGPACRACILSTIASVCGANCTQTKMHLSVASDVASWSCLPALARRLRSAQASALDHAFRTAAPFGLAVARGAEPALPDVRPFAKDLFLPTNARARGLPVYRGVDTLRHMFACNQTESPGQWAIGAPEDPADRTACTDGLLLIDTLSGAAHPARPAAPEAHPDAPSAAPVLGPGVLALMFFLELSDCASVWRSEQPNATVDGRLVFPARMLPTAVACWLTRFYGPQATSFSLLCLLLLFPTFFSLATGCRRARVRDPTAADN